MLASGTSARDRRLMTCIDDCRGKLVLDVAFCVAVPPCCRRCIQRRSSGAELLCPHDCPGQIDRITFNAELIKAFNELISHADKFERQDRAVAISHIHPA